MLHWEGRGHVRMRRAGPRNALAANDFSPHVDTAKGGAGAGREAWLMDVVSKEREVAEGAGARSERRVVKTL